MGKEAGRKPMVIDPFLPKAANGYKKEQARGLWFAGFFCSTSLILDFFS